jgi:hypothetical protein
MSGNVNVQNDESFRKLRHDIKGCLNSLVLSVEVLSEDLEVKEAADFLDGLARAADRMSGLIDQVPYDRLEAARNG